MNLVFLVCSQWRHLLFVAAVASNRTEHIRTTSFKCVQGMYSHSLPSSTTSFPEFLSTLYLEALDVKVSNNIEGPRA